MITVTDLHKVYHQSGREVRALDGVSLTVPDGSVHGIIGHSGAGKSTLVRCLAMLDRPTSGSIEIGGVELTKVHSTALRNARRRLGLVFQNANLFDSRTVWRNVTYPLEIQGRRASARERALDLLELVGLADAANAYPAQLSGGQRQRVGIARALATKPAVLL
ncbi:ATP-binding cassette domain-containing protein [Arachnia propionica]|uniref:ATP-binding cassette domain-containing protein n=1 Tax=Arachnia propionica TaxID=1750 RepID=UPI003C6FADEE